jgi:RNA polymerase sigma-70 factor, ECF subfamily
MGAIGSRRRIKSLPSWVMRVALNLGHSRWRRFRSELRTHERMSEVPRDPMLGADDRLDIERALGSLTAREREAIVLRYFLDFNTAETAATLHVKEGTVKTLTSRGRSKLAEMLGEPRREEVDDRA